MAGDVSRDPHTPSGSTGRGSPTQGSGRDLLGRDAESDASWVIKEVHGRVREFLPADRRRSVAALAGVGAGTVAVRTEPRGGESRKVRGRRRSGSGRRAVRWEDPADGLAIKQDREHD